MRTIMEDIRHFLEGFTSFYTSLFSEMKKW